ncbi:MAG: TetR/AcrR family transcriptional regulator [Carbonactinosporaceae bacterium]
MSQDAPGGDPRPAHGRRGRPRDPGADDRIRQAAVDLLLAGGYDRMTVDEVAELAGVGKATVYRRYPSKGAMATDAMQRLFDVEIPVPDTGSLRTDLEQVYGDAVAFASSPVGAAFIRLAAAEACRDERIAALYGDLVRRRLELSRPVFDRAVARGEIDPGADWSMIMESLPAVLMLRAITRRSQPGLPDVPGLVAATLRAVAPR